MSNGFIDYLDDIEDKLKGRKYCSRPLTDISNFPIAKGQALYVLDYRKKAITFQSGIFDLLGYTPEEFTVDFLANSYHPEDFDLIHRLLIATLTYATENDVSFQLGYFVTYRLKHKNGDYVKVLRQSSVFDKDEKGQIISNTALLTDISFLDSSNKVQWRFDAPGLDQQKFKEYVSQVYSGFFTERETEIISLLKKGSSSLEISESLNISKHTVDTHRRKILKRANCKNLIELLNFCTQNGI
jgi:DNA-binding CsgD family transcriptional regulator